MSELGFDWQALKNAHLLVGNEHLIIEFHHCASLEVEARVHDEVRRGSASR